MSIDHAIDLDAHHAGRFLILGRRLHGLAHPGAAHEDIQATIKARDHPDQHLAQMQIGAADVPDDVGHRIGEVQRRGALRQQDDIEEDVRDADRRDHRRGAGHVAQRPQHDPLDRHPQQAAEQHDGEQGQQQHARERKARRA